MMCTYVGVLADGVNDRLVKVTRVALEALHVVCVLETVKDSLEERSLRSLAELELGVQGLLVDVLHPVLVSGGITGVDVILEGNEVRVGDGLGVNG
jgi:hypothetical protein